MPDKINWGILGAGRIARKFTASLGLVSDARLVAIGSLSPERAQTFGDEFSVPLRYASYEELVADPSVDVVYVATRNPFHYGSVRLCLSAGKPVLCEKPFTLNEIEAAGIINLARQKRIFLMEGMWSRFFPLMDRVREWLIQERIGNVRVLQADFGFRSDWEPEGRHLNLALAGGALLDVGIYGISLSSMVFGSPVSIVTDVHLSETGVDEQSGVILRHAGGQFSILFAAIRTETRKEACLYGTTGRIEIHTPFWKPNRVTLTTAVGKDERLEAPYDSFGYQFEIAEVMKCLRQGKIESKLMPLDETLAIMRTMDAIRAQWGLRYPTEMSKLDF